jgi:hypothetical protein
MPQQFKHHDIHCSHPRGTTVPDYYPLTRGEIGRLVSIALAGSLTAPRYFTTSTVQVRLTQGISGMTCPRPADGEVAERMHAMDSLFIEWMHAPGNVVELINSLDMILSGKG